MKKSKRCCRWKIRCNRFAATSTAACRQQVNVAVRDELARYRANLVRLHHELAVMQNAAMGCRARLSERHKHLHAAQAWCAASRATT